VKVSGFPLNPLDAGLPDSKLEPAPELQTVPSFGVACGLNFLGLQVFVSGSVYPKYSGPNA
jgi:hypothetical protein